MTSKAVISKESRRASQIRSFLHVGGIAALSPPVLDKFTTTINLIRGFRISAPPQMRVIHIPLDDEDNVDLSPYWTTVFKAIDEDRKSSGRVLLLCAMGISRSATFAIAYLMCVEKVTLHDAYKHVQKCRNIICPNVGFFRQLIELEEKLFSKTTVRIIEPMVGVPVADVVWNELYDEMLEGMKPEEREMLQSSRRQTLVSITEEKPDDETVKRVRDAESDSAGSGDSGDSGDSAQGSREELGLLKHV